MKDQNEGKNIQMDFKRGISDFKEAEIASTTARQNNNNLTTGRKDLPEIYILVLVSCLYSSFIRVGGSFISVSGIVADFLCLFVAAENTFCSHPTVVLSYEANLCYSFYCDFVFPSEL